MSEVLAHLAIAKETAELAVQRRLVGRGASGWRCLESASDLADVEDRRHQEHDERSNERGCGVAAGSGIDGAEAAAVDFEATGGRDSQGAGEKGGEDGRAKQAGATRAIQD